MIIKNIPKVALMRTIRPVSNERPINRWPYSTRKVVTGAIVGVVKMAKKSWKVFVWFRKPTTVQPGTKTWWDAA